MSLQPEWLRWPQTQTLISAFAAASAPLRFVGGCVRDALLEKQVTDLDAATPLAPEAVMTLLQKASIRAIPTGIAHGTVTAVIEDRSFEITSLRRDVATDGRHAVVEYTDDWRADAARRDFTMNALYLSPEGELFDYFGGETDARNGHVRFIGNPAERIAEDYLRILRFFRFHAHYGKGAPDSEALAACAAAADKLEKLSGERISQEMFKLLAAPAAYPVIHLMQNAGILASALGLGVTDAGIVERLEKQSPGATPLEKLAALLASLPNPVEAAQRVTQRMKLPGASAQKFHQLMKEQAYIYALMPPAEQKKLLRRVGAEIFSAAVAVAAARAFFDPEIMIYLPAQWQPPQFPLAGGDLIALGIKPGKEMGELLRKLEEEWEASDYKISKGELLAPYVA